MADEKPPKRRLERPVIFVCDLQEKFAPAINQFDKVVLTTQKLLRFASALSIPVLTTTQNAPRLGPIVPAVLSLIPPGNPDPIDKTSFSMYIPELRAHLPAEPCSVALIGIETHICITQTALDLARAGHKVYLLADGVSSCNKEEVGIALDRLRGEDGVTVTSSEGWMYEVMGDAGIEEFKAVAKIVKETGQDTKTALAGLLSKM